MLEGMAGWLKAAIREHRWRGNLLPGFESQSRLSPDWLGLLRRSMPLGRNAGIKCLDSERRIPHRTPCIREATENGPVLSTHPRRLAVRRYKAHAIVVSGTT